MMCIYLQKYSTERYQWSVAACKARNCLFIPSIAELNDYCHGAGHEQCPFFLCQKSSSESRKARAPQHYQCAV